MKSATAWMRSYPVSTIVSAARSRAGAILWYMALSMASTYLIYWAMPGLPYSSIAGWPATHIMLLVVVVMSPWGILLIPGLVYLLYAFLQEGKSKVRLSLWLVSANTLLAYLAYRRMGDTDEHDWLIIVGVQAAILGSLTVLWGLPALVRRIGGSGAAR